MTADQTPPAAPACDLCGGKEVIPIQCPDGRSGCAVYHTRPCSCAAAPDTHSVPSDARRRMEETRDSIVELLTDNVMSGDADMSDEEWEASNAEWIDRFIDEVKAVVAAEPAAALQEARDQVERLRGAVETSLAILDGVSSVLWERSSADDLTGRALAVDVDRVRILHLRPAASPPTAAVPSPDRCGGTPGHPDVMPREEGVRTRWMCPGCADCAPTAAVPSPDETACPFCARRGAVVDRAEAALASERTHRERLEEVLKFADEMATQMNEWIAWVASSDPAAAALNVTGGTVALVEEYERLRALAAAPGDAPEREGKN